MEGIGKYLFWLGLLLAVVAAFLPDMTWIGMVLVILGLLMGIMRWGKSGDHGFILASLGLAASYAALTAIPAVGGYITAIMGGLWMMVGAALLVAVVKMLWDWGNM
ncbi:MAG: hypothetical protein EPO32_01815 [Anaerolineae bacterium]|nr:MAG: hypothetical protein EPO32_01815 [Anaerolineae bacterium]